jgi:hypothetical protein
MSFEITQVVILDGESRREVTHRLSQLPPAYGEDVQRYMEDRTLTAAELYGSRHPESMVVVRMTCGDKVADAICHAYEYIG